MALRPEELAKSIEHTLLRSVTTSAEVEAWCAEAREHHFAAVCVLPHWVPLAAEALRGHDVKVGTIVGFPFGAELSRAKVDAAEQCVSEGADELDVVINLSALVSGDFGLVRDELRRVGRSARLRSANSGKGFVAVKAVLEVPELDEKLVRLACRIAEDAEVDFVQTSTGFAGEATLRDVELLRECLPEEIGVKAAGDIDTLEDAFAVLSSGAARIGTPGSLGIVRGVAPLERT